MCTEFHEKLVYNSNVLSEWKITRTISSTIINPCTCHMAVSQATKLHETSQLVIHHKLMPQLMVGMNDVEVTSLNADRSPVATAQLQLQEMKITVNPAYLSQITCCLFI